MIDDMIREIAVGGMSTDADDDSVSMDEFHNLIQHRVSVEGSWGVTFFVSLHLPLLYEILHKPLLG